MKQRLLSRVQALEAAAGTDPRQAPPIEFFDRMLEDNATEEEWVRWMPWFMQHLRDFSDELIERAAKASGWSVIPGDRYL